MIFEHIGLPWSLLWILSGLFFNGLVAFHAGRAWGVDNGLIVVTLLTSVLAAVAGPFTVLWALVFVPLFRQRAVSSDRPEAKQ